MCVISNELGLYAGTRNFSKLFLRHKVVLGKLDWPFLGGIKIEEGIAGGMEGRKKRNCKLHSLLPGLSFFPSHSHETRDVNGSPPKRRHLACPAGRLPLAVD